MSTGRLGAGDTAIQPTIFDAKADILTATAADTPARLAVGSNGQYLKADSTTATGLAWATLPASGKLLQVVQGSITASASTTSDSFVDTGLSVSITPSSTTSKVLIFAVHNSIRSGGNNVADGAYFLLRRGTTDLQGFAALVGYTNSLLRQDGNTTSVMYLDSPSSTSALTYKTQFKSEINGNAVYTNFRSTSYSTIVAMEIGA